MKELVLIDVDYSNGGHNKVYADAVFRGAGGAGVTLLVSSAPTTGWGKLQKVIYLFRSFFLRDRHLHFLYVDTFLKYMCLFLPALLLLKRINGLTVTCTFHVGGLTGLFNFVRPLFDGVVVHSRQVRDGLSERSGIRIINYPGFLNPRPIRRSSPARPRFGFLGGNRPEKRYDLFIRAMDNTPHDIEVIAGGTGTDLESNGLELRKKARIISRRLTDEELRELIEYIDVLVLPYESSFKGQSGPLIEAACASKVIICSGAPVLKETVTRYNLGEVFESGDLADLLKKIDLVVSDYDRYNNGDDFRTDHSQDRFVDEYNRFFRLSNPNPDMAGEVIYINARFLTQPVTGVQRYARELVRALDRLIGQGEIDGSKYKFQLLAPNRGNLQDPGLQHIPLKRVGRLGGHAWEQFELPFYTKGKFLLSLCNTAPLLKHCQAVTIHDSAVFAFPHAYSLLFRLWYRILYKGLTRRAMEIITVSSFSEDELRKYFRLDTGKLRVIYEGAEHILNSASDTGILRKHGLLDRQFVLAVSSMNPSKNFRAFIEAASRLGDKGPEIVIAGGFNPRIFRSPESPLTERVRHVGYVNDGELRALYEHAACFVFPSLYEGFGLPPVEAMACGCPVVAARAASMPEIYGDAALYCNPHDPGDIAEKIRTLLEDPSLREDLRQKGPARARQFTWINCARETFRVLEAAIGPGNKLHKPDEGE